MITLNKVSDTSLSHNVMAEIYKLATKTQELLEVTEILEIFYNLVSP